MKYFLDTNICIAALKGDSRINEKVLLHADDIIISSIVLGELYCGVYNSQFFKKNLEALREFILAVDIAPFGKNEARVLVIFAHIC